MDYYTDIDPHVCRWMEELIANHALRDGTVDQRCIVDISHDDLAGHKRCHFFAGIGGWAYALQLAGFTEDLDVWTASLPCQPFSQAGQQRGTDDDRHLWPVFRDLVEKCRPSVIFGEQVASPLGRTWLATVQTDLEALGYSTAAADLCAAGVGAPHIRQRLYWVGVDNCAGRQPGRTATKAARHGYPAESAGGVGVVDDTKSVRPENGVDVHQKHDREIADDGRNTGGLANSYSNGLDGGGATGRDESTDGSGGMANSQRDGRRADFQIGEPEGRVTDGGFGAWSDVEFIQCADGKARPIKPGLEPLVNGVPGRVGLLRGYGNAIVPQVASIFIEEVMGCLDCRPIQQRIEE